MEMEVEKYELAFEFDELEEIEEIVTASWLGCASCC